MKPVRSYLVRALHAWMIDNGWSPHIVVDALYPGVEVPKNFVQNGEIVLVISPKSVKEMHLGDDHVSFNALFNNDVFEVYLPAFSIKAIYSKENGRGMIFDDDDMSTDEIQTQPSEKEDKKKATKQLSATGPKKSPFRMIRDKPDKSS